MEASTKVAFLTLVRVKGQESRGTKKTAGEGPEPMFCKQNRLTQLHFQEYQVRSSGKSVGEIVDGRQTISALKKI